MAEYLPDWGPAEQRLWDSEPAAFHELYPDDREWERVQEVFQEGWLLIPPEPGEERPTQADRDSARNEFYEMTNTVKSSFDWMAYREYLTEVGSPTL